MQPSPPRFSRCGDQNIGWLQIAVGDAFLVGGVERAADLNGIPERLI